MCSFLIFKVPLSFSASVSDAIKLSYLLRVTLKKCSEGNYYLKGTDKRTKRAVLLRHREKSIGQVECKEDKD